MANEEECGRGRDTVMRMNVRWRAKERLFKSGDDIARSTAKVTRNLKLRSVPGLGTWTQLYEALIS